MAVLWASCIREIFITFNLLVTQDERSFMLSVDDLEGKNTSKQTTCISLVAGARRNTV